MTVIGFTADETAVIWHDVECGVYGDDLGLWEELASGSGSGSSGVATVLDLGAGTGRVGLHLARRGHRVSALDNDPALVDALRARAEAGDGGCDGPTVLLGDAADFSLGERFDLIVAPMQLAHLLGAEQRASMLAAIAAHLEPGGIAAIAIMDAMPGSWRAGRDGDAPRPDVRERDSWIFSSLPLAVEAAAGGITVRRLRQTVSPGGDLSEEEHTFELVELPAERLEQEALGAGLLPRERRAVAETEDYVGSTVVILERAR